MLLMPTPETEKAQEKILQSRMHYVLYKKYAPRTHDWLP